MVPVPRSTHRLNPSWRTKYPQAAWPGLAHPPPTPRTVSSTGSAFHRHPESARNHQPDLGDGGAEEPFGHGPEPGRVTGADELVHRGAGLRPEIPRHQRAVDVPS